MNAKTSSPIQNSDEITDAQLNDISGGRIDINTDLTAARPPRPTGGGSTQGRPRPEGQGLPSRVPQHGTMNQPPRR
jgi:hypothetical protein